MRVLLFTGDSGAGVSTLAAATAARLSADAITTTQLHAGAAGGLGQSLLARAEAGAESARRVCDVLGPWFADGPAGTRVMLPVAGDLAVLLALGDVLDRADCEVVVVDCPPLGETVRLVAAAEAASWYLRRIPPSGHVAPGLDLSVTLAAASARLRTELDAVRQALTDPQRTSVRFVLEARSATVPSARRAHTMLGLHGLNVDLVVANRMLPSGGPPPWDGWARAQHDVVAQLHRCFDGVPVREVERQPAEPTSAAELRSVAAQLYDSTDGLALDPTAVLSAHAPAAVQVERIATGFSLRLTVPHAALQARSDGLDAVRVDDELCVTAGAHRRVLRLPSVLRRCTVDGGSIERDCVAVRFRPDPALWPRGLADALPVISPVISPDIAAGAPVEDEVRG